MSVIHTARVILAMSVLFVVVSRMTLLKKTKRLHDVVRNNGCGVTTAGFSGDNTPLVVYPLVVEWADRMVFHIEYGSHRHNILFHSFWLKLRFLQMSVQWGGQV